MRSLSEKLSDCRTELQNAREQIKRQERENSSNAILIIGQRGEITALRREIESNAMRDLFTPELFEALGWQGGTAHQVIARINCLMEISRAAYRASCGGFSNCYGCNVPEMLELKTALKNLLK